MEIKSTHTREGYSVAIRALPLYNITRIRTGESTDEGLLWEAEAGFNG